MQRSTKRFTVSLRNASFVLVTHASCATPPPLASPDGFRPERARSDNAIAAYLRDAECQAETAEQRANVRVALDDLATLPVDKLRERRYENYAGQPGMWDLRDVLRRHLVPYPRVELPEHEAFWRATDDDDVRTLADKACR